jgi:hypothetical protein
MSLSRRKKRSGARSPWPLPAPGPSRLIDAILEKVRTKSADTPAITIVLDHTIERPRADGGSDLADVLRASARVVNDGSLKFVLCRSHQKFTSLGSGKIAAGELTVIARDDERTRTAMAQLRAHEQNLGMFSSDESQLLTHFLHHGVESATRLAKRAAENAGFVSQVCFGGPRPGPGFDRYAEGLPFAGVEESYDRWYPFETSAGRKDISLDALLESVAPRRDSFAFLLSSIVRIPYAYDDGRLPKDGARISFGQESPEELVEKFYAIGALSISTPGAFNPSAADEDVHRNARWAAQAILEHVDTDLWTEAALRVLRRRVSDEDPEVAAAIQRCEKMLADIDMASEAGRTSQARAGMAVQAKLRKSLRDELARSAARSASELRDFLDIIGSGVRPSGALAAGSGDDVHAMRLRMRPAMTRGNGAREGTPPQDILRRARFAPNKIVSVLGLLDTAYGTAYASPQDRDTVEALYLAVIDAGLPGVSPSARSITLRAWTRLQLSKLASADDPPEAAVGVLLQCAHLLPYAEDRWAVLDALPDNIFAGAAPDLQRRIVDTFFLTLDVDARCVALEQLLEKEDAHKANACMQTYRPVGAN